MRIAVVGSGVSGLLAAWLLREDHDLRVFEAEDWIGGHVHTVPVELGSRRLAVDTGFIVYNEANYPGFTRLLARLGVATQPSDMSFGVTCERTGLEYGTRSWNALLARRSSALRPSFLRMLRDVPRFHRDALALIASPDPKVTLGEWLAGRGYSRELVEHFVVPMGAAIWSAVPDRLLDFPAERFLRFFERHGLLDRSEAPRWRVVEGGSQRYVDALCADLGDRVHRRRPVRRVERVPGGVELTLAESGTERFDQVVIATHSDQALALLADPSESERRVLGAIRYQPNDVVLHTDASVLPRRRAAWASWNYRIPADRRGRVVLTYHMNRLQSLDAPEELCVTLNDTARIDPARVLGRWTYAHPVLDGPAIAAQGLHGRLSGIRRTHYCGAYWGDGFHEDGVQSALTVARAFGRSL